MNLQLFQNIQSEIESLICKAKVNIKIAVTWFTNQELFESLLGKIDHGKINIELIVLNDRINNKKEGIDFQALIDKGGSFYFSNAENMVHHKFCIIDDSIVITGSYNWTYYAENRNWENIVILSDDLIVKGYIHEFEKITKHHEKVAIVKEKVKNENSLSTNDYIKADYFFQAKKEESKGNQIEAAKIYTEILKIEGNQSEALVARKSIMSKINKDRFEISPFEIGIRFKTGYNAIIPAYTKLPFSASKGGRTVEHNQQKVQITIQKNDFSPVTISEFFFR